VKPFLPRLLLIEKYLIANLISLFVVHIFRFPISSWVRFGKLCFSRKVSISSKIPVYPLAFLMLTFKVKYPC
jgi:hypothetical protein